MLHREAGDRLTVPTSDGPVIYIQRPATLQSRPVRSGSEYRPSSTNMLLRYASSVGEAPVPRAAESLHAPVHQLNNGSQKLVTNKNVRPLPQTPDQPLLVLMRGRTCKVWCVLERGFNGRASDGSRAAWTIHRQHTVTASSSYGTTAVGIECASPAGRNLFSSYQGRIRRQGQTLPVRRI